MSSHAAERTSRAALLLTILGGALGLLGFVGHVLHVELLDRTIHGRPPMQPSTAILLMLTAVAIALRHGREVGPARRVGSALLGSLVALVAALVVIEYMFGIHWTLGGQRASTHALERDPGRPSPFTALALAALGGASAVFDVELAHKRVPREWLCLVAVFFAFVSLVGHVFGAEPLYQFGGAHVIGVAINSGLALSALGIAGLLERPHVGLIQLATSSGPGGVLLRRLGLIALIGGPLVGVVVLVVTNALGLADLSLVLAFGNVAGVFLALWLLMATALPLERAYEAARADREHVHELLEQAPEGIFIANLDGHYTEVNAAGCRMLGFTREELLGKTILDLLRPEDAERLLSSRDLQLTGEVDVGEWKLLRKDGTFASVEVTAKILPDGRWQGFVRDISERLALERKVSESRDFLQKVLESSTEYGIIAEDLERRIVLWNEGARLTYGYALSEIRNAPSDLLVTPAELGTWSELHARAIESGTAEGTVVARRKDGSSFAARVVCTRRRDADNRVEGLLLVTRDLTAEQRYLAEQEFLARVGVELASCLEYHETVSRVAQLVTRFLGDIATIDVLGDDGMKRAKVSHRGQDEAQLARSVQQLGSAHGKGHPLTTVLETRRSVLLSHITAEDRKAFASSPEHERVLEEVGATSAMLVPLIARGQLLAVLSISACKGSRTYGPRDLRLAEEVARRAALTLDNVALLQQSRLQAAVTAHLSEGVALVRASDSTILYVNRRFETMFGYAPDELVGLPASVLDATSELVVEQATRITEQLERSGSWQGEIESVRKDGSLFLCAVSLSTYDHERYGKVRISVRWDITERKLLEQKNAQALRDKEVLLREIHHRVKNNLQVISSLFSLQRERTDNPELGMLLDESQTRVQSIALVHEQLYLSADLAAIDLDRYLRTLVSAVRSSYGADAVEIDASAQGVVLDVEQAVPCALLTCELISNSIKHAFGGGPGKVWVRAERDEQGYCVLEVRDDGRGIPEDFDWKSVRSLGLRLVQALTRQLRGTIELDRSQGTCFRVRFPLPEHGPNPRRDGPSSDELGRPGQARGWLE